MILSKLFGWLNHSLVSTTTAGGLLYADVWLGFTELELERYLKGGGFKNVETAVVYRETEAPYFETLLGTGEK